MKIYIVGSGGVGGYFGGMMAQAGLDVTFLARGEHFKALKNEGLTVETTEGGFKVRNPKVIDSINEIHKPDFIFFAVKTYSTEEVAKELDRVVNDKTTIITFQNGVINDEIIQKYIKKGEIYPGLAYIISTKVSPGVINQTGGPRSLIFGDRSGKNNEKLKKILELMKDSGINATLSDDITKDLWKKFIFINAFSGMTAICRCPIGKIYNDLDAIEVYKRCVQETVAVAKGMHIELPEHVVEEVINTTRTFAENSKSSLLVDVENKRVNEIESLNGTVTNLAEDIGIDVPINKLIYTAVKLLEKDEYREEEIKMMR